MFKVTKEFKKDLKSVDTLMIRFTHGYQTIEVKQHKSEGIKVYSVGIDKYNNTKTNAWFYMSYCQDDIGSMLYHLLKVNDEIKLTCRTNNNQYLTDADLFHDELLLTVIRKGKTIIRNLVLDSSTCKNNSARSIQNL